jgi:lipopolysaccharide transport system ATP-binding protein
MTDIAIRVEGLGKQYRIGRRQERYKALRDTLAEAALWPARALRTLAAGQPPRHTPQTIWALKDVSFEIKRGEVVGVIGRNGAGKSTLLKLLSRITEPTTGCVDIYGRVGSLLEVGTGFHPELTGRENLYLNGAILGMKKAEIERRFDEIVAFAEVEQFIDTPVKHYSSGMQVRLAFSVAAHLTPDIFLVDEVLAVGDLAFRRKCLAHMESSGVSGQTLLLVSHDLTTIANLAKKAILLRDGCALMIGPPSEVITAYQADANNFGHSLASRRDRRGDGIVRITSARFLDKAMQPVSSISPRQPVVIAVAYECQSPKSVVDDIALDLTLTDALGHPVTTLSTRFGSVAPRRGRLGAGGTWLCQLSRLPLADGTYLLGAWMAYRGGLTDSISEIARLQIAADDFYGTGQEPVARKHGHVMLEQTWSLMDGQLSSSDQA